MDFTIVFIDVHLLHSEACVPSARVGTDTGDNVRAEFAMPKKYVVVDQRFSFSNDGSISKVRLFAGSSSGNGYRTSKLKVKCVSYVVMHYF